MLSIIVPAKSEQKILVIFKNCYLAYNGKIGFPKMNKKDRKHHLAAHYQESLAEKTLCGDSFVQQSPQTWASIYRQGTCRPTQKGKTSLFKKK